MSNKKIEVDDGGIGAVLGIYLAPLEGLTLHMPIPEVPGAEASFKLNPETVTNVATGVSKLVEGRGWQQQAHAMVDLAALYLAMQELLPPQLR